MFSPDDPLDRAAQRIVRVGRAGRDATSGVDARASMLHDAKTLVFLSRCSNPETVFAIPAGTLTTTPLTQARRAAWRRSERRRQRRKRAGGKPSAGRRSRPVRCFQSSTSNDVDDCVKRAGASRRAVSASRSQFDTAGPGRRQRASARHGFELHPSAVCAAGEGAVGKEIRTAPRGQHLARTRCPGLSPTPSVRSCSCAGGARGLGRSISRSIGIAASGKLRFLRAGRARCRPIRPPH